MFQMVQEVYDFQLGTAYSEIPSLIASTLNVTFLSDSGLS